MVKVKCTLIEPEGKSDMSESWTKTSLAQCAYLNLNLFLSYCVFVAWLKIFLTESHDETFPEMAESLYETFFTELQASSSYRIWIEARAYTEGIK